MVTCDNCQTENGNDALTCWHCDYTLKKQGLWGRVIDAFGVGKGPQESPRSNVTVPTSTEGEHVDFFDSGLELHDQGRWEEAIAEFHEAVRLDPQDPDPYLFRGISYLNVGEYDLALEDLNSAISFDPTDADAYYYRAIVYTHLGMDDEAEEDVDRAEDLGVDPKLIEDEIEEIIESSGDETDGEGGEFNVPDTGDLLDDYVEERYENWTITLYVEELFENWATSGDTLTYTKIVAPYVSNDEFWFEIYNKGLLDGLGKKLGLGEIQVGDPEVDNKFVVTGNDEQKVHALFANTRIRDLIGSQPSIHFRVQGQGGWLESYGHLPGDVVELYFEEEDLIEDAERRRTLIQLFKETLTHLSNLGSASEEDPTSDEDSKILL